MKHFNYLECSVAYTNYMMYIIRYKDHLLSETYRVFTRVIQKVKAICELRKYHHQR
jgi:hypothetical protein